MQEKIIKFFSARNIKVYGWKILNDEHKSKISLSKNVLEKSRSVIVFGIPLSSQVFENLVDGPDVLYLHHYRQANYTLDRIAFDLAYLLEENGFPSIPVPASQIVDWKNQKATLSHKHFALLCGLGWHGRNNLVVNSVYRSRLRFATVLTRFEVDDRFKIVEFGCGECRECVEICPAGAISDLPEKFDHIRCFEKIKEITRKKNISQYICGLCIKACENGRNKSSKTG
ncbi:MAG: hypothetical protein NC931_06705 [Candidatus Omnitrophica bacterium]|nr:hypothetical protein [Candidatus Omnitrophota bacterium]